VCAESQGEGSDEPAEETKLFRRRRKSLDFGDIAAAVQRFEEMVCSASEFMKVQRAIENIIARYREIYEGGNSVLSWWIHKETGPAIEDVSTSQPSTSCSVSAVHRVDVYSVASSSSSSATANNEITLDPM
jgi:hypothetical protein